jgi:hypothetical protein
MNALNQNKKLVDKVLSWSFKNMFDERKGYFYYNKEKYFTNRIPYMRWTQAWMFLGLSHYQLFSETTKQDISNSFKN